METNKLNPSIFIPTYNKCAIKEDLSVISDPTEMTNEIADSFAKNSNYSNYNPKFLNFKKENNNQEQNLNLDDKSAINSPITINELKPTLKQCKNTSPDPDKILNVFLQKQLNMEV